MKQSGDYLKLFLLREGKVVLGRHFSNIWLLTAVLAATFFAIAFSNGSLTFLSDKMKDPFINWVDIKNDSDEDLSKLKIELGDPENAEKFHYKGYEYGYEFSYFFFGKDDEEHEYLRGRYFDQMNSDLISAILSPDNVVGGNAVRSLEDIPDTTIGIIITSKALSLLGYDSVPAYLDLYFHSTGADKLGIPTFDDRARAPLPVLGVVRRLPGNVDFISSTFFYKQYTNSVHTFNLFNKEYAGSLCYFVPAGIDLDGFNADLETALSARTDVSFGIDTDGFYPEEQFSFKNRVGEDTYANYVRVIVTDTLSISFDAIRETNDELLAKYGPSDVHRLYPYNYDEGYSTKAPYLSVHFENLNAIAAFQSFVNQFGVEIEMTQINAKENFNSVSLLASVLSWAMIAFAIICILLFLINLLQSYFQKVRKNIGTFKAFGISNGELMTVYMIIMTVLVVVSVGIAFGLVMAIQEILPAAGILKDGVYNYLSLICAQTGYSILIILVSSLLTVFLLMKRMLRSSPGDLIYDR